MQDNASHHDHVAVRRRRGRWRRNRRRPAKRFVERGERVGRQQQLRDAQARSAVHRRADDHHVLGDFRHRRHRQLDHVHGDRQAQVHAHGHQLLPVQPGRVRSHTSGVRVAAGDVVHMVQVSRRERPCAGWFFYQVF